MEGEPNPSHVGGSSEARAGAKNIEEHAARPDWARGWGGRLRATALVNTSQLSHNPGVEPIRGWAPHPPPAPCCLGLVGAFLPFWRRCVALFALFVCPAWQHRETEHTVVSSLATLGHEATAIHHRTNASRIASGHRLMYPKHTTPAIGRPTDRPQQCRCSTHP